VAWIKTEAGKREMQTRSRVSVRTQRNLLVLIDGRSSVQALLSKVTGASEADFEVLREAGLIEFGGASTAGGARPASAPVPVPAAGNGAANGIVGVAIAAPEKATAFSHVASNPYLQPDLQPDVQPTPSPSPSLPTEPTYAHLSATLTRLVSTELGLRGLPLTLAVEKARTVEDLRRVADTVVTRIRERRGEASAAAAHQALFGV